MKSSFWLIVTSVLFFSCTSKKSNPVIDHFESNIPEKAGVSYLSTDSFVSRWYSEELYSLKEPILYSYSGEGQAIRLVWLRSFENPVVVRLNNFNDTVYATIKELSTKYSRKGASQFVRDTIIPVDISKWKESLSILETNAFWNAPEKDSLNLNAKDGTPWFLECRLRDRYRFINRWDEGSLSSKDLHLFAKVLVEIGQNYIEMKSRSF
jgi:hypothetical protein